MPPQQIQTPQELESLFRKKYWFSQYQMVTVVNPTDEDYHFLVDNRPFMVPKGSPEPLAGFIANVYLDRMSRELAQRDDALGDLADANLRAGYYEKLVVDVEDMTKQYANPTPDFLKPMEDKAEDKPFAQIANETAEATKQTAKTDPKEFTYADDTFRAVPTKDGKRTLYYKNGKLTTQSEFQRAASMI